VAAWREARFDLVLSPEQLAEIGRVLAYRKIRKVLRWDDETIGRFLKQLMLRAEMVELDRMPSSLPGDAGDVPILASLLTAKGDWLVTGDGDLLALRTQYPILPPAEFVKKL
jgi:putative PIN family toxin of toxin-antitoxin system